MSGRELVVDDLFERATRSGCVVVVMVRPDGLWVSQSFAPELLEDAELDAGRFMFDEYRRLVGEMKCPG